jgi:hypothetical protein
MRKILLALVGALALVLTLSSAALADEGKFTVRHSSSLDSGTCGNNWANDNFTRVFTPEDVNGTSYLREDFKNGRFDTIAGSSPGACESGVNNGHLVTVGIDGSFHGFLAGTVTGGTFNPEATCPQPCNGTTFVAAFYGPAAVWNVNTFKFEYQAQGDEVIGRHWQNASADQGGNQGDIYTS